MTPETVDSLRVFMLRHEEQISYNVDHMGALGDAFASEFGRPAKADLSEAESAASDAEIKRVTGGVW